MKKALLLSFTFFFLFIQNQAWCWNRTYHLIIAQIAVDQLTEEQKNKLQLALAHSRYFSENNNYLHAAIFPDELKQRSNRWRKWHYINLPYSPDGIKTTAIKYPNVVSVIQKSVRELKHAKLDADEKALFLSLLIHMVGDIHQPLHCINRFNHEFPHGDKGGNLFLLPIFKTPNLHALWDDGLELRQDFYSDGRLSFEKIRDIAMTLENRYPKSFFRKELNKTNPMSWAKESYSLAINYAYQTPVDEIPSTNYFKQSRIVVAKQITLAGYRLGEILKRILS